MLSRFSLVLTLALISLSDGGGSVDDSFGWILAPWWFRAPIISHSPSLFKEVEFVSTWNWSYHHGSGGIGFDADPVRCGLAVFVIKSGSSGGGTSVGADSDWQGTAGLLRIFVWEKADDPYLHLGGGVKILVWFCIDGLAIDLDKFGSGSLEMTLRVGKYGDHFGGAVVGVGGDGEAPSPYGVELFPHLGSGLFPHGFWALGFRLLWAWRYWASSFWLAFLLLGDYVGGAGFVGSLIMQISPGSVWWVLSFPAVCVEESNVSSSGGCSSGGSPSA